MALTEINLHQSFNAPVETVFDILSDHAQFGDIISANIKRIVDSQTDYINGLGSVRKIFIIPTQHFEETITAFEPNKLIEYKISKGSPLKNHTGTMKFSSQGDNQSHLDYNIVFESKLPLPGFAPLLKVILEKTITRGLKQLANSLN